jgi:hypothetical protein
MGLLYLLPVQDTDRVTPDVHRAYKEIVTQSNRHKTSKSMCHLPDIDLQPNLTSLFSRIGRVE